MTSITPGSEDLCAPTPAQTLNDNSSVLTFSNANCFQAQLTQQEHAHAQRLLEVTARHHQELDMETDRLRDAQLQAEQALESREKAHRQRVRCLEEQVF